MGLRSWLFAAAYDRVLAGAERAGLAAQRSRLLAAAAGDVLEIGAGTGLNLSHYKNIESLTLVEPAPAMVRRLNQQLRSTAVVARVVVSPAEDLPFLDESFDTVVSTLVLCSVENQSQALGEIRRVLRPGGRLLFLEHVRSTDPPLARRQDQLNWLNRLVAGCDCNRSTVSGITAAGLVVDRCEQTSLPNAPRFTAPAVLGWAATPD